MRRTIVAIALCAHASASAGPVPATLGSIRDELEGDKDLVTARCAREAPVPRTVSVTVIANRYIGDVLTTPVGPPIELAAPADDAFTVCFAREAMQVARGRSFVPDPFKSAVTLELSRPEQLLARAVDSFLAEEPACWPRPGSIPHTLAIEVASDDVEMTVTARTTPSNTAVEACVTDSISATLDEAGIGWGDWKPALRVKRRIEPRVSKARFRGELRDLARQAAASCVPADVAAAIDEAVQAETKPQRIGTMRVTATAKRDAATFTAVARSGDTTRDACTARALEAQLRERFELRFENETVFRIDGNASANASFEIETQGQLDARFDAERARARRGNRP